MFKYNLQSVLKLREKIEDAKKKELGTANQNYEHEVSKQLQLTKTKNSICGDIKNVTFVGQEMDITYIKQASRYMDVIKDKIQLQEKIVDRAEKEVEIKRDELKECVKERKILENLKEIHFEEYLVEESRIEQRAVDEVVTYRHKVVERE